MTPIARDGGAARLDPLFTQLTGITQDTVDAKGQAYGDALAAFDTFSDSAQLWSWGKDELNLIGTGAVVRNCAPPIPLARFGNACNLLLAAGIPYETVTKLRSNTLLAHFNLTADVGRAHDALADAKQVALVVQHLLQNGSITRDALSG